GGEAVTAAVRAGMGVG
ncbi:hypothetical protein, partial [Burkholderia gladioli]